MTLAIKRFTRLEMSFNSVERIVELMETEQEPPVITDIRPPTNVCVWPSQTKLIS
jgi:hypothetical protein